MKATVREYTVKKKVVVIEIDEEEEAKKIVSEVADGGYSIYQCGDLLIGAVSDALEADRAEEQRKDTEDVPF